MLKQKIQEDTTKALKEKEELCLSVLRVLSANILNKEKEKRFKLSKEIKKESELEEKSQLKDEEIIDVISSEIKKRKESAMLFEKGNRQDLAKKEKAEIEILQKYLPEQLKEEEVVKIVETAVLKTGAKSIKEMGKVMAEIMPKVRGKADSEMVSRLVKESLS